MARRFLIALTIISMTIPFAAADEVTDGLEHAGDATAHHAEVTCDSSTGHAEAHSWSNWWSENAAEATAGGRAVKDTGNWYADAVADANSGEVLKSTVSATASSAGISETC